jgi:hypothetical protein
MIYIYLLVPFPIASFSSFECKAVLKIKYFLKFIEIEELPPIDHGIPITDRRSTFQAHLAPVVCPKQVKLLCLVHCDAI